VEGKRYRIRPEVRQLVRFAPLNLAEDGYPSAAGGTAGVDLILCRNVLLYFAQELTQRVVRRFHAGLAPGGWLVLGPSDPRPGLLADFEMHAGDGAIVYRRIDRDIPVSLIQPDPVRVKVADAPVAAEPRMHTLAPPVVVVVREVPVSEEADWHAAWVAARASADGGELDLAEEHCKQAIARAQMRPEPYYLFGALRQARGDDAGSLAAYRKALYVDPRFVPALFAQAAIHRRSGAPAQARITLGVALLLNGQRQEALRSLNDGVARMHYWIDISDASGVLERLLAARWELGGVADAHTLVGVATLNLAQQWDKAVSCASSTGSLRDDPGIAANGP